MPVVAGHHHGIVAARDVAVRNVDVARRDDVQSVAVGDHKIVVDFQVADRDSVAVDDQEAPVGRIHAFEVVQFEVGAVAEDDHLVKAVLRIERAVADAFRNLAQPFALAHIIECGACDDLGAVGVHEFHALSEDDAVARDRDVRGIFRVEDARQFVVVALVLREVGRRHEPCAGLHAELDVRTQVERSHEVVAFGNIDHAAALLGATVDSLLDFLRRKAAAVVAGAEFRDVVDTGRITAAPCEQECGQCGAKCRSDVFHRVVDSFVSGFRW